MLLGRKGKKINEKGGGRAAAEGLKNSALSHLN